MYGTAIAVWTGLMIGNFIYEAFGSREWGKATAISFFQAGALAVFLFVMTSH